MTLHITIHRAVLVGVKSPSHHDIISAVADLGYNCLFPWVLRFLYASGSFLLSQLFGDCSNQSVRKNH